jgi:hypothetical protein
MSAVLPRPFETSRRVASVLRLLSSGMELSGSSTDRCRTIVEPVVVSVGSTGLDGVERRLSSSRRNMTLPNVTRSPGFSSADSTRTPFTYVPLLEPRSRTRILSSCLRICACRREIVGSMIGKSLVGERPTTTEAVSGSEYPYVDSVLWRRKGI